MQTTVFLKLITRSNRNLHRNGKKRKALCKSQFSAKFQVPILQLGAIIAFQTTDYQKSIGIQKKLFLRFMQQLKHCLLEVKNITSIIKISS